MEKQILQLGGPHLKTCVYCGVEFYGRKNQKYCCPQHKSVINNEKQANLIEQFNPWFQEMIVSYKALKSSLHLRDENKWIKASKLTTKGFDPDVATKTGTSDDSTQFKFLFDIAYLVSEDLQFIKFTKMKKS